MRRFAETCEAVGATTKKNQKVAIVADYLKVLPLEAAARAVVFLTGRPFAHPEERILAVGPALLWEAVVRHGETTTDDLKVVYRRHGDLGDTAQEVLKDKTGGKALSLQELATVFQHLAACRASAQKQVLLDKLFCNTEPVVVKYIIKIILGDPRIGLRESLVEEAIAQAYGQPLEAVRRANMLTSDIAKTLHLAASGSLAEAQLRLFHPVAFMLASPVETAEAALQAFPEGALVEDKYDGIRAQVHKQGGQVELFSRTRDRITEFPELNAALARLPDDFLLDGEIVGWANGRALPFVELQKRLGRKQPHLWLQDDVPVRFFAFDALCWDRMFLLDLPLSQRRKNLEELLAPTDPAGAVQVAPATPCGSSDELGKLFEAALARGNEGVMIKAPDSAYAPGRRGRAWLKLKRPLATLDVVVTAVEYGHGKRRSLLSDYTFAVRAGNRLLNIGKAYSGLTDQEIQELTGFFKQRTLKDQGFRRIVQPELVLEVAFNNIQRSRRHESGYALRFPRIVRLRRDKSASDIDTLDRVRKLYARQSPSP